MNKQTRNKAYPQEFREQVVKLAQDGDELGSGDAMRFRGPASSMRSLAASGTTRLPYLPQPKKSETS